MQAARIVVVVAVSLSQHTSFVWLNNTFFGALRAGLRPLSLLRKHVSILVPCDFSFYNLVAITMGLRPRAAPF